MNGLRATLFWCIVLSGCTSYGPTSKPSTVLIDLPMTDGTDDQAIHDTASELRMIAAQPNLFANYKTLLNKSFDRPSDPNVSLVLFLNALVAYDKANVARDAELAQFAQATRARWAKTYGIQGIPPTLTPIELKLLDTVPQRDRAKVLGTFHEFGIKTSQRVVPSSAPTIIQ